LLHITEFASIQDSHPFLPLLIFKFAACCGDNTTVLAFRGWKAVPV